METPQVAHAAADSVPLGPMPAAHSKAAPSRTRPAQLANVKILIMIFLFFVLVCSEPFVNTVLAGISDSAVRGRNPTSWGVVIQGTCLVILYIIGVYLLEQKVF